MALRFCADLLKLDFFMKKRKNSILINFHYVLASKICRQMVRNRKTNHQNRSKCKQSSKRLPKWHENHQNSYSQMRMTVRISMKSFAQVTVRICMKSFAQGIPSANDCRNRSRRIRCAKHVLHRLREICEDNLCTTQWNHFVVQRCCADAVCNTPMHGHIEIKLWSTTHAHNQENGSPQYQIFTSGQNERPNAIKTY